MSNRKPTNLIEPALNRQKSEPRLPYIAPMHLNPAERPAQNTARQIKALVHQHALAQLNALLQQLAVYGPLFRERSIEVQSDYYHFTAAMSWQGQLHYEPNELLDDNDQFVSYLAVMLRHSGRAGMNDMTLSLDIQLRLEFRARHCQWQAWVDGREVFASAAYDYAQPLSAQDQALLLDAVAAAARPVVFGAGPD